MAIKEVRKVLPIIEYFTKNGGINSVTSAASAGYIPLILEVLNNPATEQGLTALSGGSVVGAVVASVLIAVRAGLAYYRSR
jgi:hypothetical protein